jgi:peptide deformylase
MKFNKEEIPQDIADLCIEVQTNGYNYVVDKENNRFAINSKPIIIAKDPKIVYTSDDIIYSIEQDPDYPEIDLKVKRSETIRIRFTTPNGDVQTHRYSGMTAALMQICVDRLEGIGFFDRVSKLQKDRALKKTEKWRKKNATS